MLRTWSASDAFGLTPRVPADPLGQMSISTLCLHPCTAQKADHSVTDLCRVLRVTRSGFYAWCERSLSAHAATVELIRFRGHVPKGGYDVPNGKWKRWSAAAPAVL